MSATAINASCYLQKQQEAIPKLTLRSKPERIGDESLIAKLSLFVHGEMLWAFSPPTQDADPEFSEAVPTARIALIFCMPNLRSLNRLELVSR
ncbi:hypothetical protein [Rhizobium mesosinicum]|uniref:Uncharacterized protein n=1 Tax=Rhizobium mesosinicum TaxID=335017 RepID=A0ABS7GX70_9HYPH|nr:hypothetical protein [Rhizobium mesosinicum]MBW9054146.1 hypothetical protein [Rhizobium mesosinicum]